MTTSPFDPLPTKLPLSDKARGNLKRELELMPKMSFARNATSEQRAERARAVEGLLEADAEARKATIHNGIKGVRLSAVRSAALTAFLRGQAMLVLPDGDHLVYWDDWLRFVDQQDD